MATYKGIQGMAVIPVTSDPTPAETYAGQLWYNSADGKFKIAVAGDGTWASGGTMNTARSQGEGATSGTATNTAISSGTEIVGAGVASFNPRISATDSVTEVDIDLDATAGTFHVFAPNISAAIASKHLYMGAGSTCDTALTAFRGTLEIEYSVY